MSTDPARPGAALSEQMPTGWTANRPASRPHAPYRFLADCCTHLRRPAPSTLRLLDLNCSKLSRASFLPATVATAQYGGSDAVDSRGVCCLVLVWRTAGRIVRLAVGRDRQRHGDPRRSASSL